MRHQRSALRWALAAIIGIGTAAISLNLYAQQDQPQQGAQVDNGKALGTVQDLSRAFRNVGKEVEPSVVNIKVRKVIENPRGRRNQRSIPFNDPFFRRFFDEDGDGIPDFPWFDGAPFGGEQIGQGSGVIVEVDGNTGYIVTNNHVAGDADEMTVVLNDGRTIENAELVGTDPKTDLAVIKIEADNLKAARWGDSSQLEKGDWVLAFGSPFGYVGSMTHGIVSATNRTNMGIIPAGYEEFLQIDAPINPGNSGGPLTNIHGEVIGINTAIASRTGGFQGVGFAIPSNQAKQIYQIIREKGKVVRGWLGVVIASVDEPQTGPIAQSLGYDKNSGVFVHDVLPDTPATGKLKAGDIITKLNGKPVKDSNELRNRIAMISPGTEVKLEVFREGKTQTIEVTLGDQPATPDMIGRADQREDKEADTQQLGVTLNNLTPDIARQLGLPRSLKGAVITRVLPGSTAARAGLTPGMVITRVGNQEVTNADEAVEAIRKLDLKKGAALYVVTRDGGRFIFVQSNGNRRQ